MPIDLLIAKLRIPTENDAFKLHNMPIWLWTLIIVAIILIFSVSFYCYFKYRPCQRRKLKSRWYALRQTTRKQKQTMASAPSQMMELEKLTNNETSLAQQLYPALNKDKPAQ